MTQSPPFAVIYRKAGPPDFPGILSLQKYNLLKNLDPGDQKDGFLSIEYTSDQLELCTHEPGIFVAAENDRISGYLITQTIDFAVLSPLIKTMIRRFPDVLYRSRPLSGFRTFIYGPVCINKKSRGQGILEGLFRVMFQTLKGRYDIGVAFVSEQNPRSLSAHHDKLEMTAVDEFEFNGQRYRTLVFDL